MPHTFGVLSLLSSLIKGGLCADALGSYGLNYGSFYPVSVPASSSLVPAPSGSQGSEEFFRHNLNARQVHSTLSHFSPRRESPPTCELME